MKSKNSFTLAETLITLAIVGFVASLAIPSLIKDVNNKIYYSQFQEANAIMMNLGLQFYRDYSFNITDIFATPADVINAFSEKLQYQKVCDTTNFRGNCWHVEQAGSKDRVFNLTKTTPITDSQTIGDSISLKNGMLLGIEENYYNPSCDGSWVWDENTSEDIFCAEMMIDVNGFKGPNVLGRDIFTYILTKHKFYPAGMDNQDTPLSGGYCNPDTNPGSAVWENGKACTYRLILERAMNY